MNWFNMIIGEENRVPNYFLADEEELFGRDWFELKYGSFVDHWNTESTLRSSNPECDGKPDDALANALGWPVFSSRLRRALDNSDIARSDVQYLPIRVAQSTGVEIHGFAVANVIARIPALDRERTKMLDVDGDEIDPLTGRPKISGFWKAALVSETLAEHDIIRLVEFFPPIFVSQRFVDVFQSLGFTGATFSPVPVFKSAR